MSELTYDIDRMLPSDVAPKLSVFQSKERLWEINSSSDPRYTRRLADQITTSFYECCRVGNLAAAEHLVEALECEVLRSIQIAGVEDRYDGDDLAAVKARYELEVRRKQREQAGPGSSSID